MSSCEIFITGDFDGGNPKDKNSITQIEDNVFEVIPYSEDNDSNYKFRLDIKAINNSTRNQQIHLIINWQEPIFQCLRDYIYIENNEIDEWKYISGQINGENVKFKISLEPGKHHICLHPKYNYEDYMSFVNSITINENIKKEIIGCTPEGRDIWLVKIMHKNKKPKKRMLFVSRIHPYETAGSYNAEGIIKHFLNTFIPENSNASYLHKSSFAEFEIYVIPMANPDGVFNGLAKRTSTDGIDLSKQLDLSDMTCGALVKGIDIIKPHIYVEFHNWMFKDRDGIYYLNWFQARKYRKLMPSQIPFNNQWVSAFKYKLFPIEYTGLKKYAKERYGSKCVCFEYPWFDRTMGDMRQIGFNSLKAISFL